MVFTQLLIYARAKSVRGSPKKLKFEDFERMLKNNDYTTTEEWHFSSNIKDVNVPSIKRIDNQKVTNRKPWAGRLPWNPITNRRVPFSNADEKEATKQWAVEIDKINKDRIEKESPSD
jgi:hypothetical protein